MLLTKLLKDWAVANLGVAADATDKQFTDALAGAIVSGKLAIADYTKMADEHLPDPKKELATIIAEAQAPLVTSLTKMAEAMTKAAGGKIETTPEPTGPTLPADIQKHLDTMIERGVMAAMEKSNPSGPSVASRLMGSAAMAQASQMRVRSVKERYDNTKSIAICPTHSPSGNRHPRSGKAAEIAGKTLMTSSQFESKVNGAFAKWQLFGDARMSQEEKDLVEYALREMDWCGPVGGENNDPIMGRKLTEMEQKAVINDTTSGGNYAVPIPFDEAIILTPLLFGELFPFVDVQNLARGNYVMGSRWTNQSWVWGTTEGTAFSLATTTGIISALDTTIYPTVFGIELGLDWESDTPIDFGGLITKQLGDALKVSLDKVIAVGQTSNSTEPLGIFNTPGMTQVSAVLAGSLTGSAYHMITGDMEKLYFGLNKAMRASNPSSVVFLANDTQYRHVRAIPTAATWNTRAYGMDYDGYNVGGKSFKVQNDIADGTIGCVNLSFYRMYRRLGLQVRNVVEGLTLARTNTRALIFRARFGGQLTLGSACCYMDDANVTEEQ